MDKLLPTIGILLVVIVVLALAIVGWRRRVRRDAPAGGGYPAPQSLSAATASSEVLYVATTKAGEPLERLALPGLAYRGRGTVDVSSDGVQLRVTGEDPVFIPAASLTGVGASTVAIDRVVERDGLVRLCWTTSGGVAADSYFRVVDPAGRGRLTAAVDDIIPAASTPGDSTEREV
ncbi:hypothetical protein [uncultured Leifsonia sp.]|uniref:PH-like domain-containing protein n=1 Tax=uncultured Leifsonia sp. TaxID=340359 RepID=UPI0025E2D032|nr:hypothetical protein [uncultured Leifsonia sp.]